MVDLRTLTSDDRKELVDAIIQRFREGEFGPASFRVHLQKLGVTRWEIDVMIKTHIDECAKTYVTRSDERLPFASGLR